MHPEWIGGGGMSYIIMAIGEDGTEFRATELEYPTACEAWEDIENAEARWPDATLSVEKLMDMEHYLHVHQQRFDADEQDLY